MSKQKINAASTDPKRPLSHLEPIVQALISNGNRPLSPDWFSLDQDGWHCLLEQPIDFDLLLSRFEFPSSVNLSRANDAILDTLSWVEIKGSGGQAVASGSDL